MGGGSSDRGVSLNPPVAKAVDLRKFLRAKMAAALQAHQKLAAQQVTRAQAEAETKRRKDAVGVLKPFATDDEVKVREFIALVQERYLHWLDGYDAETAAVADVKQGTETWAQARRELAEAVAQAAVEELQRDETFLAAQHMSLQLAPPPPPPAPVPAVVAPPVVQQEIAPLSDLDKETLQEVTLATLAAALVMAKALHTAPAIKAAIEKVKKTMRPAVSSPVRPTEEEVQRYLKQSEQAVVDRLAAHKVVLRLLPVRATLKQELYELNAKLVNALQRAAFIPQSDFRRESGPLCGAGRIITQSYSATDKALGEGYDASALDQLDMASPPSKREVRQIEELRGLMRNLAYAKAHLNEAKSALTAAEATQEHTHTLRGINAFKTWAECLAWRAQEDVAKLEMERQNNARRQKIELLTSLVAQYHGDVADAEKSLYRYVVAIKPPVERPPCDEFRNLLNTAAWMYDHVSEGNKRECDFPVY
jgi:hypothetical protein